MLAGPVFRVTLQANTPIRLLPQNQQAFTVQNLGPGVVSVGVNFAQGTTDQPGYSLRPQGVLIHAVSDEREREVTAFADVDSVIAVQEWQGAAGFVAVLNPPDAVSITGPVTVTINGQPISVTVTNDPLQVSFATDPLQVNEEEQTRRLLEEMLLVLYDIRDETGATYRRGSFAARYQWKGGTPT